MALLSSGCGLLLDTDEPSGAADGGDIDAAKDDAGVEIGMDAARRDASERMDAGRPDAREGTPDAGPPDAGEPPPDGGPHDADEPDAGAPDAGPECRPATAETDCDDGDPCTTERCSAEGDCGWEPRTCDPSEEGFADCYVGSCAPDGVCEFSAGPCDPGEVCDPVAGCVPAGECRVDGDCPDDGAACTGTPTCAFPGGPGTTGVCVTRGFDPGFCGECGECLPGVGDELTGCVMTSDAAAVCHDAPCRPTRCVGPAAGPFECLPGFALPLTCSDAVPCTADVCAPEDPGADANGCLFVADDTRCDVDGVSCTLDACVPGDPGADASGCVTGPGVSCDDGVGCTTDSCAPAVGDPETGCFHLPRDVSCAGTVACEAGTCAPGDPRVRDASDGCFYERVDARCDDLASCTRDSCVGAAGGDSRGCTNVAIAGFCDDGLGCTNETCAPGAGPADSRGCVVIPVDDLCPDDEFACTRKACRPRNVRRDEEGCVQIPDDRVCDDGAAPLCLVPRCDPGGPGATPAGCTVEIDPSRCAAAGSGEYCDAERGCIDAPSCVPAPDDPCDDGIGCNGVEACVAGTCRRSTPEVCADPAGCRTAYCPAVPGVSGCRAYDPAACFPD